MTNIVALTPEDLAERLRTANRLVEEAVHNERALAAIAKAIAALLSERLNEEFDGQFHLDPRRAAAEADENDFVKWAVNAAKEPVLRLAMTQRAVDAAVEHLCGGSPGGHSPEPRAPGFVDAAVFDYFADLTRETLSVSAERAPVALTAAADESVEEFEAAARFGFVSGAIDLRADGVALTIRVAVREDVVREAPAPFADIDPIAWRRRLDAQIDRTPVHLAALLAETSISVAEIAACRVGSVLTLRATPHTPISLAVEGKHFFDCALGQAGGHYTVRVSERVGGLSERGGV